MPTVDLDSETVRKFQCAAPQSPVIVVAMRQVGQH